MFLCSVSFTWQLITSCCAPSLMLLICRALHALYYYVTPYVLSHQPELSSGGGGGCGQGDLTVFEFSKALSRVAHTGDAQ